MKLVHNRFSTLAAVILFGLGSAQADSPAGRSLLDFDARRLGSEATVNLREQYEGRVLLVVNTASQCAFTGQYEGLEALYAKYRERGLVVLGFPSNDFGNQEPGTEEQIKDFCRLTYSVKFPMFAKTRVRQGNADPFFQRLGEAAGSYPKWNFHKYLIDRNGRLADDFQSFTSPKSDAIVDAIEELL